VQPFRHLPAGAGQTEAKLIIEKSRLC